MRIIKRTWKRWLAGILLSVMLWGNTGLLPITVQAAVEEIEIAGKMQGIEDYLRHTQAPYDLLIKLDAGEAYEDLSREEQADIAQARAVQLLEKGIQEGRVESYERFYIVNAIHALVKDASLLRELAALQEVEKITSNNKIWLIEPIKDEDRAASVLYQPDERRIEWGVLDVHADTVWESLGIEGEGVTVGIIDTGVNYRLPALKQAFKGYDAQSGKIDKSYYKDCVNGMEEPEAGSVNDHGTHVAGIIVGKEGEKLNRIGVAPKAKFISAKALDEKGGDIADLLEAGEWMLRQKPDIINNSWGGDSSDDIWFKDMAQAWKEAGIVAVFASGNQLSGEGTPGPGSIANPGNLLNVIAVGAVDREEKLGSFSKRGPSIFDKEKKHIKPDLVAPGVQVRSVDASGRYVSWNGTSMAAPHVAGVLALMKEANPNLSVDEMAKILQESAKPLSDREYKDSPNMGYGYGLVDAYAAVSKAQGKEQGRIYGSILKEGKDSESPRLQFQNIKEAYLGRELQVNVQVEEDISIRSAKLYYKNEEDTDFASLSLDLFEGLQNRGVYRATIPALQLKAGELSLRAEVVDYAGNQIQAEKKIEILPGVALPWENTLEENINGFILEGNWKWSEKLSAAEPNMPDGGRKYLGIDAGKAGFEKQTDSYLYLPPIRMEDTVQGQNVVLNMDMFKSFTGISVAKLEASFSGAPNDWELVHNVTIRPDITDRSWENNSYSLRKYSGSDRPLLLRLYFRGHDADKGEGWYIDNLRLDYGDSSKPGKVEGLKAVQNHKGLDISFIMNEETDMLQYELEKRREDGGFVPLAVVFQDEEAAEFIHDGKQKTHYRMHYYDTDIQEGEQYAYRVRALDNSRNEGAWSEELYVRIAGYTPSVAYDFEADDGAFTAEGEANDWEYGKPQRPESTDYMQNLVWSGLEKNKTKMWGTKLNAALSKQQDSYLYMPTFRVKPEDYIYIDSFSTVSDIDEVSFTVEVKEEESESWYTLFHKQEIQDQKKQHSWFTLEKSLQAYAGKEISLRFHVNSGNGAIFPYQLGWYIDNIYVSRKVKEIGTHAAANIRIASASEADEEIVLEEAPAKEEAVPLRAKIQVLETGNYTYASLIDGTYEIKHICNEGGKPYTLVVSAYGYEPFRTSVDLSGEKEQKIDAVLKPAKPLQIEGSVKDEQGNPLADVQVRIIEDENLPVLSTDIGGKYQSSEVFSGEYTLRFYKRGYYTRELKCRFADAKSLVPEVRMEKIAESLSEEIKDYGGFTIAENDGDYQTVHFKGSTKGIAQRFQASYEGSMLKSISVFAVNNRVYGGSHIQIGILGYDEEGRLREWIPFREYEGLQANAWNEINLEEFTLRTDQPFYVATRYEKPLIESTGIYYDTKAGAKAKERAFIYDGAFTSVSVLPTQGAFAVKACFLYRDGSKEIQEAAVEESGKNPDAGSVSVGSEEEFTFDKATRTITKYHGKARGLTIPKEIGGVPVKRIGEKAFDGTGKSAEEKLEKLIVPEGVELIDANAFQNNRLKEVSLPDSLAYIGKGAFRYQYKSEGERQFSINIPKNVHHIEKETFDTAGDPVLIEKMENVESIAEKAFAGNKNVELHAPKLQSVVEGAFGNSKGNGFQYAKIYTDPNSPLTSAEGEYLINPALVKFRLTDAGDREKVYRIALLYGRSNPKSYSREIPAGEFYRIGEEAVLTPPDFRDNGKLYISRDKAVTLRLEKENILDFYYYALEPTLRLPILDTDDEVPGFALPQAQISCRVLTDAGVLEEKTVQSNEDGYFVLHLEHLAEAKEIALRVDGKEAFSVGVEKAEKYQGQSYIAKGSVLLRYLGEEEEFRIPSAVGSGKTIDEISAFAFYGKKAGKLILHDKIKTISSGAFMDCGIEELQFNVDNVHGALLRSIQEYAFKGNRLKRLILPELTHIIRTAAFEDNMLEHLELGKYTGHIGARAFKNNRLKELHIPGNTEEIGEEAFRANQLEKLSFRTRQEGAEHYLTRIPSLAFAGNKLRQVRLPDYVDYLAKDCFDENEGNVAVYTDNADILPGIGHDIVRSDGSRLQLEKEPEAPLPPKEPGSQESEPGLPKEPEPEQPENGGTQHKKNAGGGSKGGAGGQTKKVQASAQGQNIPPLTEGRWRKGEDPAVWQFVKTDGTVYRNTWICTGVGTNSRNMSYAWFRIDKEGFLQTGFYTDEAGNTYYLSEGADALEGAMLCGWHNIRSSWYYFEEKDGKTQGMLYRKQKTPDGYTVDEKGIWDGKAK